MSKKMTRDFAVTILNWKYDSPYDLYNNEVCDESINELMYGGYRAVVDREDALIGFYCTGPSAQVPAGRGAGMYPGQAIDIGLGMKPEITGNGYGYTFFTFVLKELEGREQIHMFRLTVAAFNKRAIKLYEKMGFSIERRFSSETNEFITMVKR
ncbi:GNAT family N-acetyltransferase [Mesobacillus thioparans]|uniref:GNAT family N-acetyltransferase n=1 Tax=Mesobacillus thioparans TaxID=370439 RepID=UPI0039EF991A